MLHRLFYGLRGLIAGVFSDIGGNELSGFVKTVPRGIIFAMAYPYGEICVNPGAGVKSVQPGRSRMAFEIIRVCDRFYVFIVGYASQKLPKEIFAVVGVIFPAIFSVENHVYQRRIAAATVFLYTVEPLHKIRSRRGRRPSRIDKTYGVRQSVVPEKHIDVPARRRIHSPRLVNGGAGIRRGH